MKKHIISCILFFAISFLTILGPVQPVHAQERAIDVARRYGHDLEDRYQPAGSIITEINTGQILWAEDSKISWSPASMTKLMTILVVYDAMAQGRFSLDTNIDVAEKYLDIAGRYALSNNKMKPGGSYTIAELIDLIIGPSSAAATYMLADQVEPDPDGFVELMNKKAAEIGMKDTIYYNIVGVPSELLKPYQPVKTPIDSYNLTTPEDYALLCGYLVKTYPDILNHTNKPVTIIKEGTPVEERYNSYQMSLEGAKHALEGTDGLKTGSSEEAGFNFSSTAKRGDTRLVEVVMGVSTWSDQTGEEIRHLVSNPIMEEAFKKYEYRKVLDKGRHVINGEHIELEKDLWDCVPKDEEIPLQLKDGKVSVALERNYLPGYKEPTMAYKTVSKTQQIIAAIKGDNPSTLALVFKVILICIVTLAILLVLVYLFFYFRRMIRRYLHKKRRRNRKRNP